MNGDLPRFPAVFLRLFTIQASWNYERMQGTGFGHAVEPALRGLEGGAGGPAYRAALARQSQFFNAHPYLAALAVGAAARLELEGQDPERIERLRGALGGPLGSLGDRLFWASWLPSCAALGVALVALGLRTGAVVAFLVCYNVVHLATRWWALRAGWQHGLTVGAALASPPIRAAARLAAPIAGVAVGAAVPLAFAWQTRGGGPLAQVVAAAAAVGFALLARAASARMSGSALAALVLGAAWLVGSLWK